MLTPLRAATFALYFYGVTLFFVLAGIPLRLWAPQQIGRLATRWARSVLAGLRPICGIHVVVRGLEHIPATGPVLMASQHQSAFDTIIWIALLQRPCYVMKQELVRIPLFGPLLRPAGMIPVDRSAGAKALRGLLGETSKAMQAGRQIVIFPEGTRMPPGQIGKLQPGIAAIASRLGMPVLPVATDSGRCWGRKLLARHPGRIHIVIGPPIGCGDRAALLPAIEFFWRSQAESGFSGVDNSVEPLQPMPDSSM